MSNLTDAYSVLGVEGAPENSGENKPTAGAILAETLRNGGEMAEEKMQELANAVAADLGVPVTVTKGDTEVVAGGAVPEKDALPELTKEDLEVAAASMKTKKKTSGYVKRELEESDAVKELAEEIIVAEHLDTFPAKIGYFLVWPNISKTTIGTIKTTTKELKFYSGKDYIIEVSGEVWDVLDATTRRRFLEHQLRHILVLQNEKTGDWQFKLKKHDVQDFSKLIEKYGSDWIKTIKLCTGSLYGLTPREEDAIHF